MSTYGEIAENYKIVNPHSSEEIKEVRMQFLKTAYLINDVLDDGNAKDNILTWLELGYRKTLKAYRDKRLP